MSLPPSLGFRLYGVGAIGIGETGPGTPAATVVCDRGGDQFSIPQWVAWSRAVTFVTLASYEQGWDMSRWSRSMAEVISRTSSQVWYRALHRGRDPRAGIRSGPRCLGECGLCRCTRSSKDGQPRACVGRAEPRRTASLDSRSMEPGFVLHRCGSHGSGIGPRGWREQATQAPVSSAAGSAQASTRSSVARGADRRRSTSAAGGFVAAGADRRLGQD